MSKNVLEAWQKSLRSQVAEFASVFSDDLSDEKMKADADAAFKKMNDALDALKGIIRKS